MAERKPDGKARSERSLLDGLRRFARDFVGAAPLPAETPLRVRGDSMWPTLPDGSAVMVRHTRRGIAPGTIIAYRRRGDLIIHRVVAVLRRRRGGCFYLTKGDHNSACDQPVAEGDVLGPVVAVEPAE